MMLMKKFTPPEVEKDATSKFNILNEYSNSSWSLQQAKQIMAANLEVSRMDKETIHNTNKTTLSELDDKLHTKKRNLIYDECKYRVNTNILSVLKIILLLTSIIIFYLIYKRYNT